MHNDKYLNKITYFVGNGERDGGCSSTVHSSKPKQLLKVNILYVLHIQFA